MGILFVLCSNLTISDLKSEASDPDPYLPTRCLTLRYRTVGKGMSVAWRGVAWRGVAWRVVAWSGGSDVEERASPGREDLEA